MLKCCPSRYKELLSPLELYLQDINATPLLNAEQERTLALRVQTGDKSARDHMVRANLRLVVSIAQQYANRSEPELRPDLYRGREPGFAASRQPV